MTPGRIRPIVIGIFIDNDRLLVFEGRDPIKGETFYRPLGGGIEFGEYSEQALRRELQEEIGAEVGEMRYFGMIENVFTHNGQAHHEIVIMYHGEFKDAVWYERSRFEGYEADGSLIPVLWKPIADFGNGKDVLYPAGLLELLMAHQDAA